MTTNMSIISCKACLRSDAHGIRCTECRNGIPGLDACNQSNARTGYECGLVLGHDGEHRAFSQIEIGTIQRWSDESVTEDTTERCGYCGIGPRSYHRSHLGGDFGSCPMRP